MEFFSLVDRFLASALVPAYTAAAFAKRFARLSLVASPAVGCRAIDLQPEMFIFSPESLTPFSCVSNLKRP